MTSRTLNFIINVVLLSSRQHVQLQCGGVALRPRGGALMHGGGALRPGGGASVSQFGFAHAAHQLLQFDGERHVSFDTQLPRHEGQRGLQLPCNMQTITAVTIETPPLLRLSLW